MVAAAIIGSAVVGGVASSYGANQAGKYASAGASAAAQAQYDSTKLQVDESRRQFDLQLEMLMPMIEAQYGAQAFFADVLGFGGYDAETGTWDGGGPGSMGFGAEGGFFDPNLNPEALGEADYRDSDFYQHVVDTALAGDDPENDPVVQRVAETQFGTNYQDDPRYQRFLEDGNLVGTEFEESPGYEFAVEEMNRATERQFSAGGQNAGGRAVLEAQRRGKGLADQEYYNWLGQRRQDQSRGDRLTDVSVRDARRREEINVARGDSALDDYFRRKAGDVQRQDSSILRNQELRLGDRQRQDQGYYNFLNMIMGQANSGAVNQGVGASARAGANIGGAYQSQGNNLSRIWQSLGDSQANIAMGEAAGWNNALQSGMGNWVFNDYLNNED